MNKNAGKKTAEKKFSFSQAWNNKRIRPIILSGIVIFVCVAVYAVLLLTVLKPEVEEEKPTIGNHGEQMMNGRPYIVGPYEASQVRSIRVENENGGFYYYMAEDGQFYFEGAEAQLYATDSEWMNANATQQEIQDAANSISIVDSLMFLSRSLLSTEEVLNYNPDLSVYGLDGKGKASMTLSYVDGAGADAQTTVYFGNRTTSGASYYVRVEGRDAVYILADSSITRCMFADIRDYMLPQVAPVVSSTLYSEVDQFTIAKHGETFLDIRKLTDEEYEANGELFSHVFVTPSGYYPSVDDFPKILEQFMTFSGNQVMEFGIAKKMADPEQVDEITKMLKLYSLMDQDNKWVYELNYEYKNPGFKSTLYISEKLEVEKTDGEEGEKEYIYYVYSPGFDVIVEFDAESLAWVEWDLLTYMDNHTFSLAIDSVATIEMAYGSTKVKYSLQGTGDELKVSCTTGVAIETNNFRQLYKAIIYTTSDGYAERPENLNSILSVKITTRDGTVYDYHYYGMTARKAYYTLNGFGEFYVNRDYVKQMISACNGILAGEEVVVERKN